MLNPGEAAPDFRLPDQEGKIHDLKDYRGKWVVLYFYPKDNTSGCTREAQGFRDLYGEFARLGAAVLGVSPDSIASHQRFAQKLQLPFPLLADPEKEVLQAYGVWQEKKAYGRRTMGVVRTTFLIDPQGYIEKIWPKVKVDGHPLEVLEYLNKEDMRFEVCRFCPIPFFAGYRAKRAPC